MERIPELYAMYGQEPREPGSDELSEVERLMNEFEVHEGHESEFTRRYKEISEKTANPLIRFLLRLIVSDEEKHHAVTHAMVSTLRGDLTWTKPEDAISGLYELAGTQEELLRLTEDFIEVEKSGIEEYKRLIKVSKGYYHGLFSLLLRAMVHDSEKHVEILEFLRQRLKEA